MLDVLSPHFLSKSVTGASQGGTPVSSGSTSVANETKVSDLTPNTSSGNNMCTASTAAGDLTSLKWLSRVNIGMSASTAALAPSTSLQHYSDQEGATSSSCATLSSIESSPFNSSSPVDLVPPTPTGVLLSKSTAAMFLYDDNVGDRADDNPVNDVSNGIATNGCSEPDTSTKDMSQLVQLYRDSFVAQYPLPAPSSAVFFGYGGDDCSIDDTCDSENAVLSTAVNDESRSWDGKPYIAGPSFSSGLSVPQRGSGYPCDSNDVILSDLTLADTAADVCDSGSFTMGFDRSHWLARTCLSPHDFSRDSVYNFEGYDSHDSDDEIHCNASSDEGYGSHVGSNYNSNGVRTVALMGEWAANSKDGKKSLKSLSSVMLYDKRAQAQTSRSSSKSKKTSNSGVILKFNSESKKSFDTKPSLSNGINHNSNDGGNGVIGNSFSSSNSGSSNGSNGGGNSSNSGSVSKKKKISNAALAAAAVASGEKWRMFDDEFVPMPVNSIPVKPERSYAQLIGAAIVARGGKCTLNEIYDHITLRHPWYRQAADGWRNSIRHNLSISKLFENVPRDENDCKGKGGFWRIRAAAAHRYTEVDGVCVWVRDSRNNSAMDLKAKRAKAAALITLMETNSARWRERHGGGDAGGRHRESGVSYNKHSSSCSVPKFVSGSMHYAQHNNPATGSGMVVKSEVKATPSSTTMSGLGSLTPCSADLVEKVEVVPTFDGDSTEQHVIKEGQFSADTKRNIIESLALNKRATKRSGPVLEDSQRRKRTASCEYAPEPPPDGCVSNHERRASCSN